MEPPKRHVLVELCPEKVVDELTTFILVPIVHGLVLEYKVCVSKRPRTCGVNLQKFL